MRKKINTTLILSLIIIFIFGGYRLGAKKQSVKIIALASKTADLSAEKPPIQDITAIPDPINTSVQNSVVPENVSASEKPAAPAPDKTATAKQPVKQSPAAQPVEKKIEPAIKPKSAAVAPAVIPSEPAVIIPKPTEPAATVELPVAIAPNPVVTQTPEPTTKVS